MCMHPNLMMLYIRAVAPPRSLYLAAGLAVLICGYQPAPAVERYLATCPRSPLSLICPISIQPPGRLIPNTHAHTIILLCSK